MMVDRAQTPRPISPKCAALPITLATAFVSRAIRSAALAITLCVLILAGAPGAKAQTGADPAAARCQALRTDDFLGIPTAPTTIISATPVAASGEIPAYCQAVGFVNATVEIVIDLPVANWNGKFAHTGSHFGHIGCTGAECGKAFTAAECDGPVARGYACIVDDEGHKGPAGNDAWAYRNPRAEDDFAFRATHLSTLAGKAITARFYGKPPARSYFLGCADAGRQALVEAQKFPADYDGIVAGAPPIEYAANALTVLWNAAALLGPDGKSVFPAEPGKRFMQPDLQLLRKWIADRCDKDEGVKDGMMPDPRLCRHFDPAELQCKGPKTPTCLTAQQIAAVRKIQGGPVDERGEKLTTLTMVPGSEGNWAYSYLAEGGGPELVRQMRANILKFMSLSGDLSTTEDSAGWRGAFAAAALQAALYDASNPDLRRFKAAGGKLIAFQGWSDHEVLPDNLVDYYETVDKTMGGATPTKDFFRLFMIPRMDHCGNGGGADKIEYMAAIEDWVEKGKAPDVLVGFERKPTDDARYNIWPAESGYWLAHPWDKAASIGSRPVYPYPIQAKYKGSGDESDAANWGPLEPKH
jgi:feruloyl esterase